MFVNEAAIRNSIFKLIKEYTINFKLKDLYKKRAEILPTIMIQAENGKLCWKNPLSDFIKKILISPEIEMF